MKKIAYYFIALVVVVLAVMNVSIWQKEQILAGGETVYIKLAPVDPRSLMQGDYMVLNFAINDDIHKHDKQSKYEVANNIQYTHVVITTDVQQVAAFVRLDDGKSVLADGEKRLKLNTQHFRRGIKPNSFFFQEGHAKFYEAAKYGIFTFAKDNPDSYLLTGLADKDLQAIVPAEE